MYHYLQSNDKLMPNSVAWIPSQLGYRETTQSICHIDDLKRHGLVPSDRSWKCWRFLLRIIYIYIFIYLRVYIGMSCNYHHLFVVVIYTFNDSVLYVLFIRLFIWLTQTAIQTAHEAAKMAAMTAPFADWIIYPWPCCLPQDSQL